MKICIVENEPKHSKHLVALIRQWEKDRGLAVELALHESGEAYQEGSCNDVHIAFLDIQMEGMNGVELATHLRQSGFKGELVFLTDFSEYVFDGYDVNALNYYLKPIQYEKLARCLDYVQKTIQSDFYIYRERHQVVKIPYSQMIYLISANHQVEIITTKGEFRQADTLKRILGHLPENFCMCHRTAIINRDHIVMLKGSEVTMSNGQVLPVSKTHLEDVRTALLTLADELR